MRAQAIFSEFVADWASSNPHGQDYGIDYTLEVFDSTIEAKMKTASGLDFQVQLKGTASPTYTETTVAFDFDAGLLAHFLDNKRLPVFLVVVDVSSRRGYFLFLQGHAASMLKDGWRTQKTIRLHIPLENDLSAGQRFKAAVHEADVRMSRLRPGPVDAALDAAKSRLETMDPRVTVELTATAKGVRVVVFPKEDITGTMSFSGQQTDLDTFLQDCIDRGQEVSPEEYGVKATLSGLPLLERPDNSVHRMRISKSFAGSVRLSRLRAGDEVGSFEIDGEWVLGTTMGQLFASLPNKLLSVAADLGRHDANGVPIKFNFTINISDWIGKDIASGLKYFDRLRRVFGSYRDGDLLRVELTIEGNLVGAVAVPIAEQNWACLAITVVDAIEKARYVAHRTNRALILVESIQEQQLEEIDYAYAFLRGEPVSVTISSGTMTTVARDKNASLPAQMESRLSVRQERFFCDVLGEHIDCGPAELSCERAICKLVGVNGNTAKWTFEQANGVQSFARSVDVAIDQATRTV